MAIKYRAFGTYRFLLAVIVVLSHTWFLSFGTGLDTFIQAIGIGNIGVAGFFVLSGFIIAEALASFYQNRPIAFFANRFLRLYPPYIAAVIIAILVHVLAVWAGDLRLPDYTSTPEKIFTAQNFLVNTSAIFPVFNFNNLIGDTQTWYYYVRYAWAVFVEFMFYIVMLGFVVIWNIAPKQFRGWPLLVCFFLSMIGVHLINEAVRFVQVGFSFIPYFGFGVAAFAAFRYRSWSAVAACILCYILLMAHFLRYTQGQIPIDADWLSNLASPKVYVPWAMMGVCAALVPILFAVNLEPKTIKIDSFLGDLSYPIYLNHYAVLVAVYSVFPSPNAHVQVLAVVLSLAVAWGMHALVETPMKSLRDRIRGQKIRA